MKQLSIHQYAEESMARLECMLRCVEDFMEMQDQSYDQDILFHLHERLMKELMDRNNILNSTDKVDII